MQLFRGRPLQFSPRLARDFTSLLLVLPAALLSRAAAAQTRVEARFTAERFQAEMGPRNYLVTAGARTDGAKTWSAGIMLHYGYRPFVVRSCITDVGTSCDNPGAQRIQDVRVVENIITADLLGSYTIIPRLQLGLRLPVTWLNGQGIQSNGLPETDRFAAFSIGDPNVEAKGRLYGEANTPFVLGGSPNEPGLKRLGETQAIAVFGGELETFGRMQAGAEVLAAAGKTARFFLFPRAKHGDFGPQGNRMMGELFDWLLAENQELKSAQRE